MRIMLKIFASVVVLLTVEVCAQKYFKEQPRWDHKLDLDVIEKMLLEEKIISSQTMRAFHQEKGMISEFDGKVSIVTLSNGLKAVFKHLEEKKDAYGEVAAYKAARYMNLRLVPPTVIRAVDGRFGTLQLFVEPSLDLLKDDNWRKTFDALSEKERANIHIFNFVFGRWDTGPHNTIVQENNGKVYVALIDNESLCNCQKVRYGELPFVRLFYADKLNTNDWDKPFSFTPLFITKQEDVKSIFGDKITLAQAQRLKPRSKRPIPIVVWRNSVWRQFHSGDDNFILSYTPYISADMLTRLKNLKKEDILRMFSGAEGEDFMKVPYFISEFLWRRDQVINLPVMECDQ